MRSIIRRPRAASLRRPEAVIEPSGNANSAAMLSRKAVFDLTVALSGTFAERVTPENGY
jgi:hypothetical protein